MKLWVWVLAVKDRVWKEINVRYGVLGTTNLQDMVIRLF